MSNFFQHKFIFFFSLAALFFFTGGFLWALLALHGLHGGPLILHFNDMAGITAIGGWDMFFFMGILGMLIAVINAAIAFELEPRSRFLARFIAVLTLAFSVLLFFGFVAIIRVN